MFGKIAGAIGLLLLSSSSYTFFITTGSPWLAGGKALVGVALIGAYFATNWKQFGQFASRRSTFFMTSSAVMTVLVLGLLTAVNYVAAQKGGSWDLTQNKIFSLAPQSVSTIQELKEPVTALAFLPPDHPSYDAVADLLERYHREGLDKFLYQFKDPRKTPDLAQKYALRQGQITIVLTRGEGDTESHTSVSLRTLAELGPEQELTNALIKLNAVGEQKVYFVEGHAEWPFEPSHGAEDAILELVRSLRQEGYSPETINLAGKTELPKDAALVVVAGAKSRLTEPEVEVLRMYLAEGGRMAVFAEAMVENGLDPLLADYGVQVDNGIVTDTQFAVDSPYNPVSMFYGQHEMTTLLQRGNMNVQFLTSRGLTVLREGMLAGVQVTPVVLSSPFAWEELTPNQRPEPSEGEKSGQIPLVVASTRNTSAAQNRRFDEARLVVFGDSELLVDARWGIEPNRNLVMNAFAWTTNQANKITLRPPDRDISRLDLDDELLARIRFLATDLMPVTLLGIGLAIWLTRRNK
ncbi:MAG: Gldg family protein [Myxococcaceae bacterium]